MTFTRSTVGAILAMAIIGASALAGASTAVASQSSESGRITNVIYLLGDGMGVTHVSAARERYAGLAGRLAMETLPAHGWSAPTRWSADPGSPVPTTSFRTRSRTPPLPRPRGRPG